MQVIVKGKNVQVTPALREHAEKKAQHLARYFPNIDEVLITQRTERNWHVADVTLQAGGLLFRGEERSNDMYVSVDLAMEKLERQLKKFRDRFATRLRETSNRSLSSVVSEALAAGGEAAPNATRLVRRKRFPLKPMSAEEAMMQMELLGHDFFVFTNTDTQQVNVLYKRNDGNFGLIEPEV